MAFPIDAGVATLRRWQHSDLDALVAEGNSHAVWRNLIHTFPHPYTDAAGSDWIERCIHTEPSTELVIAVDDQLVGTCGIHIGEGVGAFTGSVGYWIGERHWGRGIASAALAAFLDYIWRTFGVERLEAEVFAWNSASARVLEKNGFVEEGTRRRAIFKDGEFVDESFYSLLRSEAGLQ